MLLVSTARAGAASSPPLSSSLDHQTLEQELDTQEDGLVVLEALEDETVAATDIEDDDVPAAVSELLLEGGHGHDDSVVGGSTHDAPTKVEAAAVHIQAGHFDDTIPGLAHFHEHMYVVVW